ncbi:RluA family pseudouridine synthase [Campylobacter fetus]|uniref:RluA family pseudouridine synthase n=1 Tax=Campylobacter fetus TaxID=196 RepID=UPI00073AB527|nr:RluA family pseudouridine synthase [Campylobacter fetus]ALV65216.1 23S rRNA pseudouridine synthase [Campylobacter fetus subsp. testudinum Sp3]
MNEFISSNSARLDQILASYLSISRNQISELIKSGNVYVNDNLMLKPSFKVLLNDKISFNLPKAKFDNCEFKADFDVEILYEDDDILVLNKPSNLTVHPAPSVKEATLVEWLKQNGYMLSTLNGDIRAGIVHRLDKGTSGVIVVAKNNASHSALTAQLSDKSMGRVYLALIDLNLKDKVIIDRPIGRNPQNRLKNSVVANGRAAKSAFTNIICEDDLNLIAAKLFTGRTHQIRVHLASINRHILGDNLYDFKSKNCKIKRVMLHAYILNLIHPKSGEKMQFVAPLPTDFYDILSKKIDKEILNEKIDPEFVSSAFYGFNEWMCL